MAANDALIASLLLGQRQKKDPLEIYQSFGRDQIKAGSSTAPLGSGNALEGIARALQGGIGGLMQGYAIGTQQDQDAGNLSALTRASTEKSSEGIAKALSGIKGNSELMIPMLGQIIQGRLNDTLAQEQARKALGVYGTPGAPQASAPPAVQQGGGAAPAGGIPQPGYAASSGGISSNNIGNVTNGQGGFRQYATPQEGAADAASLLRSYPVKYNNGQPMTLTQIGARYTPADDGKDPMLKGNDPVVWARNVGQIAGIDPNAPLDFDDPAVLTKVVNGINAQEKGRGAAQPSPVLGQGVAQAMDPTAFPPSAQAAPGNPGPIVPQPAQGAGPTPAAPQGPPTAMSSPAGDQLRQLRQRAEQMGDDRAALEFAKKAAEEDAKWSTEVGKKNVDQSIEQQRYSRERADKQSDLTQPTTPEMHKLRDARAEADAIIGALNDFRSEFEKGAGIRSIMGASTPANTAYNNAALLMKGEGLYNLGVLSGPDLDIIRRTLPDPSTFAGQNTSKEEMRTAVGKITNLINSRIAAKERAMGIAPSPDASPAPAPGAGAIPAPPPGFTPLP